MESTHIMSNPRTGKLKTFNEDDDGDERWLTHFFSTMKLTHTSKNNKLRSF